MKNRQTRVYVCLGLSSLIVTVSVITAIDVASGDNVPITICQKTKIASGGWSTVYRAEIAPRNETIAIKQLKETKKYKVQYLEICVDGSIVRWRFYGQ